MMFEPIRFTVRYDYGPKIIDARVMISEIAISPIGCSIGFEVLRGSTIETKQESKARRRAERAGGRLLRKRRLIKKRQSAIDARCRLMHEIGSKPCHDESGRRADRTV